MATLVDSSIIPHPFSRDSHHTITFSASPSPLESSAAQLAPLASQHHTSEYSRLKFGHQGCPIRYLPLSIQLPDFFHELRQRQVQCSQAQSWWPCAKPNDRPNGSPVILGPCGALPQDSEAVHLQEQIQAAIAATLDTTPPAHTIELKLPSDPSIKTSLTHPINISSIVPPEFIPLISSHLLFSPSSHDRPSPIVFEVPYSFALDRFVSSSAHRQNGVQKTSPPVFPPPPQFVIKHLRTRTSVTEALQAAISGGLSTVNPHTEPNKKRDTTSGIHSPHDVPHPTSTGAQPLEKLPATLHSNASSISLTLSLTLSEPGSSATTRLIEPPPKMPTSNTSKTKKPQGSSWPLVPGTQKQYEQELIPPPSPPPDSHLPAPAPQPSLLIGNLLLSSCPGKKVRLQGPIKGRSGVCRDLDTDLKRMKELGVGCVICCLDDGELEFLGAPWSEYEVLARNNGIDVLRIPTPEGLAPLAPACLDAHLTKVINDYTLHGIPVLVHCRGGVGRAGVIACCWLIRLGICGWVDAEDTASVNSSLPPSPCDEPTATSPMDAGTSGLRKDTIRFVEKVIAVVRRRRSMKAIETYEQVRFLIEFVEYLREGRVSGEV